MKEKIFNMLFEKYGMYMEIKEIATVLRITPGALRNKIYIGDFPVATWKPGQKIVAQTEKIAEYIAEQEDIAEQKMNDLKKTLNS